MRSLPSPLPVTLTLALAVLLAPRPLWANDDAPTPPKSDPVTRFAKRIEKVIGVAYAAEVAPGLYRGGQPNKAGVQWLKDLGVRTVINLRHYHGNRTSEGAWAEALGMRYEHIPLESSEPPTRKSIERFLALLADPSARPIYVHCQYGVDRTGTMIAIYRMEVESWTNQEALSEMLSFGAHAVWRDLQSFVATYQPAVKNRDRAPSKPQSQ